MRIVEEVYQMTRHFPADERFGLVTQMRRAAISIPSNIAEDAARNTAREFANFLHIAQGSLSELDTQLELSSALAYVRKDELYGLEDLMVSVDKMITGLIKSLRRSRESDT